MSVTRYVALPFVDSEEGPVPAEAQECPNEGAALLKAVAMSRKVGIVGTLAFKRTGMFTPGLHPHCWHRPGILVHVDFGPPHSKHLAGPGCRQNAKLQG